MATQPSSSKRFIQGILASAVGKAIYLTIITAFAALYTYIYETQRTEILVPKWAIFLIFFIATMAVIAASIAYARQSFDLTSRLNSEAFGTSVRSASQVKILNTFIPNLAELADDLVHALDQNSDVHVLAMHPKCEEAVYRAATLGKDLDWVVKQIDETLDILENIHKRTQKPHLLKVRLFKSWPPFSMYATDKKQMIGYYWAGALAIQKPQLILSKRHASFSVFIEQFATIWSGRDSADIEILNWRKNLDLMCFNRRSQNASYTDRHDRGSRHRAAAVDDGSLASERNGI